jgi:predicted nucleic acid-binding protein
MIIVSDTTPLHYLILIDEVDLLPKLFGEIIIPVMVLNELQTDKTPQKIRSYLDQLPEWLSVRAVPQIIDHDLDDLDPGERAAILLSEELSADAIIIDDLAGRKAALTRGIRVFGTLGLLEIGGKKGVINFNECLDRIKTAGFYMSRSLENKVRSDNA